MLEGDIAGVDVSSPLVQEPNMARIMPSRGLLLLLFPPSASSFVDHGVHLARDAATRDSILSVLIERSDVHTPWSFSRAAVMGGCCGSDELISVNTESTRSAKSFVPVLDAAGIIVLYHETM